MGTYYKVAFIFLFIVSSYAIDEFSLSLENRIGINKTRINTISDKIRIKFGKFSRSSSATATYNPLFNIIKFNKSLYSNKTRSLKTIEELIKKDVYGYQVSVATIFHELGHAELDTIIEESKRFEDRELYEVLKFEVSPWFKKNFRILRPWDAVHELYGYYRTSIIENIFNSASELLLDNGIVESQKRCFLGTHLKKAIKTQSREEFSRLQVFRDINTNKFKEKSKISYIFMRGRDYNLGEAKEEFKDRWFEAMWVYLDKFYSLPKDASELVPYMTNWPELSFVTKCREGLWDNYHSTK